MIKIEDKKSSDKRPEIEPTKKIYQNKLDNFSHNGKEYKSQVCWFVCNLSQNATMKVWPQQKFMHNLSKWQCHG